MRQSTATYTYTVKKEHVLPFLAGRRWLWKVSEEGLALLDGKAWTKRGAFRQTNEACIRLTALATLATMSGLSNIIQGLGEMLDELRKTER